MSAKSMRESAAEENLLSALAGIRNTINQSASLRTQLATKDAEIARLHRALRRVRKNIPEGALTAFEIIADALNGNGAQARSGFEADDYRHLAAAILASATDEKALRALLSNNLNVILAALNYAGDQARSE